MLRSGRKRYVYTLMGAGCAAVLSLNEATRRAPEKWVRERLVAAAHQVSWVCVCSLCVCVCDVTVHQRREPSKRERGGGLLLLLLLALDKLEPPSPPSSLSLGHHPLFASIRSPYPPTPPSPSFLKASSFSPCIHTICHPLFILPSSSSQTCLSLATALILHPIINNNNNSLPPFASPPQSLPLPPKQDGGQRERE